VIVFVTAMSINICKYRYIQLCEGTTVCLCFVHIFVHEVVIVFVTAMSVMIMICKIVM